MQNNEQANAELAAAFAQSGGWEPDSITANRAGQLSQKQQQMLLRTAGTWTFPMGVSVYYGFLAMLSAFALTLWPGLGDVGKIVGTWLLFAIPLGAFFAYSTYQSKRMASLQAKKLAFVDGMVKTKLVGTQAVTQYRVRIGGKAFFIDVDCGLLLTPNVPYRVYYEPFSFEALNIEVLA